MSGGKGGSQTTGTEIPEWAMQYAQQNLLGPAQQAAQMGYMPYYGPDVAAMTPAQEAAMQSGIGAAEAYGLIAPGTLTPQTGMPAAQTFAGGVRGYSSGGLYDQALAELTRRAPGQMAAYQSMFVDPMTGLMPQIDQRYQDGEPTKGYIDYLLSQGITGLPEGVDRERERDRKDRDYTLGGRISSGD